MCRKKCSIGKCVDVNLKTLSVSQSVFMVQNQSLLKDQKLYLIINQHSMKLWNNVAL